MIDLLLVALGQHNSSDTTLQIVTLGGITFGILFCGLYVFDTYLHFEYYKAQRPFFVPHSGDPVKMVIDGEVVSSIGWFAARKLTPAERWFLKWYHAHRKNGIVLWSTLDVTLHADMTRDQICCALQETHVHIPKRNWLLLSSGLMRWSEDLSQLGGSRDVRKPADETSDSPDGNRAQTAAET